MSRYPDYHVNEVWDAPDWIFSSVFTMTPKGAARELRVSRPTLLKYSDALGLTVYRNWNRWRYYSRNEIMKLKEKVRERSLEEIIEERVAREPKLKRSRKQKKQQVMPAKEVAKMSPWVDFIGRIADLRGVPNLVARIRRLDTGGNDVEGGIYIVEDIDIFNFKEMIYERHGSGRYEIRFHDGKKPLLLTNGRLEKYRFRV